MKRVCATVAAAAESVWLMACATGGPRPRESTASAVSLAELADSSAIVRDLGESSELAEGMLVAWPMAMDRSAPQTVQVLHSTLGGEATERVREVIQRHLRSDTPGSKATPHVIYANVRTGTIAFRVNRATGRAAELVNGERLAEGLGEIANRYRRDASASVAMLVGLDGRPIQLELRRGTGDQMLDRDLVELARLARFNPGQVEGYPAVLWIELPLEIRAPRPPGS